MLHNEEFKELTQFFHDEYSKIQQAYGIQDIPTRDIKVVTKATTRKLKKYAKLDDWKDVRRIKVQKALFTMPHNFIWKMFHKKLWYYVQEELKHNDESNLRMEEQTNNVCLQPTEVVANVDMQAMSYPSSNITKVQI